MENMNSKAYPDHWIEGIVRQILERKPVEINLSTGKTPSGHIHLGILRELIICDCLRRIFQKMKYNVNFRIFFDSLDPLKRFPEYIPKEFGKEYLGKPMAFTPNPFEKNQKSYAEVFGEELMTTLPEFGIQVTPMWTHKVYEMPEMKQLTRIALKKNEYAKEIITKYLSETIPEDKEDEFDKQYENWTVAVVICDNCHSTIKKQQDSIVPNRVLAYEENTDEVTYHCPNCGFQGKQKISDHIVKLSWRVDWPAKWSLFNIICEPAGKDHCTPGGSYDTGLELCQKLFGYQGPVKVPYEWLRLGDKDMKTSKGIVFTPSHYLELADPIAIRTLILMTNPNKHISFRVEELPQYYNEFERIERVYYGLEKAINDEEDKEIKYIYPLIILNSVSKKCPKHLPFKLILSLAQLRNFLGDNVIYQKALDYMTKENFPNKIKKSDFLKQIIRAKNWLSELQKLIEEEKDPAKLKILSSKAEFFSILDNLSDSIRKQIDEEQKAAFRNFLEELDKIGEMTEDNLKDIMMGIQQKMNIKAVKFFQAFYLVFLGTLRGPRLGPFLILLEKDWVIKRIKEALI